MDKKIWNLQNGLEIGFPFVSVCFFIVVYYFQIQKLQQNENCFIWNVAALHDNYVNEYLREIKHGQD